MAARGAVVRAFASTDELSPAQLRDAPAHWPRPSALDVSLQALEGVGPKTAEAAASAGIATVGDLLLRFPHRHRDRTVVSIASLELKQKATIAVEVLGSTPRPFRKRGLSIVGVKVGDDSDTIRATWFNQPWVAQKLTPGTQLLLTGTKGNRGFVVAEYEFVGGPRVLSQEEGGTAGSPRAVLGPPPPTPPAGEAELVPVHPLAEGLRAKQVREWLEQAIGLAPNLIDGVPAAVRARYELAGVADAVKAMHFPRTTEEAEAARERLRFEELFLYQAILATRKRSHRVARPAPKLGKSGERVGRWIEVVAVRADEGSAEGLRRDRRGSRFRGADAAAADGRGRVGEDRGRSVLDAASVGSGLSGGADGTDGDTCRAARGDAGEAAGGRGDSVCAVDGGDAGGPAQGIPRAPRDRRVGADRRHACIDRADCQVRPPGPLRRRRAASVRGRAAQGTGFEGGGGDGAARAAHDRDADPADAVADRLRRPGHDRAARAALGPKARADADRRGGRARRGLRVHPGPAARGSPGLRRLPVGRGVRENAGARGGGRGGAACCRRVSRLRRRGHPRPDVLRRQGCGDGGVCRRRPPTSSSPRP